MFFHGALEIIVLQTLTWRPMHGYALVQHVQQRSESLLQVEEGSLYPALQRLLKGGFVEGEWELSPAQRRIRVYRITPAGEKRLEQEASRFEQLLKGLQLLLALIKPYEGRMRWFRKLRSMERDLADEIAQRLDEKTAALMAEGLGSREGPARRAGGVWQFGGRKRAKPRGVASDAAQKAGGELVFRPPPYRALAGICLYRFPHACARDRRADRAVRRAGRGTSPAAAVCRAGLTKVGKCNWVILRQLLSGLPLRVSDSGKRCSFLDSSQACLLGQTSAASPNGRTPVHFHSASKDSF